MYRFYLRSIAGYRVDVSSSVHPKSDDASLSCIAKGRRRTYAHRAFERDSRSAVGVCIGLLQP